SAHTVFTNDRFPRSGNKELSGLETSDVTEETLTTRLERGVTIGANATIGPGITLGEFSMIGMGSVVTRDVPAFALVHGSPARVAGWLAACGHPLLRGADLGTGAGEGAGVAAAKERGSATTKTPRDLHCPRCGRNYRFDGHRLSPTAPIVSAP